VREIEIGKGGKATSSSGGGSGSGRQAGRQHGPQLCQLPTKEVVPSPQSFPAMSFFPFSLLPFFSFVLLPSSSSFSSSSSISHLGFHSNVFPDSLHGPLHLTLPVCRVNQKAGKNGDDEQCDRYSSPEANESDLSPERQRRTCWETDDVKPTEIVDRTNFLPPAPSHHPSSHCSQAIKELESGDNWEDIRCQTSKRREG